MEPTFVIAGGQRCGTTSLYHLLDQHPDIYLARPVRPEPKFFLQPSTPPHDKTWYLDTWFQHTGSARARGEKSTSYLESPAAAQRMKVLFPKLRAIFILRHPIERAWSNYWYTRAAGLETLGFDEAILHETERVAREAFPQLSTHPFAYAGRGHYAALLAPYFEHFAPEELCIVLHDDLQRDPDKLAHRLFDFLGVNAEVGLPIASSRHNASTPNVDTFISKSTLDYLFEHFAEPNRLLSARIERDLSDWERTTPLIERFLS